MKRTASAPEGLVAVMEEPEDWSAALDREQREAQDAKLAERNEAQHRDDERLRLLVAGIGEYWPALQQEWRRVGATSLVAVLGPSARGFGDAPHVVAGVGGCEMSGARGSLKVTLDDEGELVVSRRAYGSGYDVGIRLQPTADGSIVPSPEAAVREIIEPLVRQLGRIA